MASWEAGDNFMPTGYYYWSCYTTKQAAEKQVALKPAGKVLLRTQIIFCSMDEF